MKTLIRTFLFAILAILIFPGLLNGQVNESSNNDSANMKSLIMRYYDCWNTGTVEALDEILAVDYIRYEDGDSRQAFVGRESIKENLLLLRAAYSELNVSVTNLLVSGDKVTSVWRLTGNQTGQMGKMAPTGKQVDVSGVSISRITKGKIVEEWSFFNQLNLWAQLGYTLMPPKQKTANTSQTRGDVIINGRALSSEHLVELEHMYRVKAQPVNYWYDAKSGLYGIVGQPSFGFMYLDHDFGKINRKASMAIQEWLSIGVNCLKQNGRYGARFWAIGSTQVDIGSIPEAMQVMKEIQYHWSTSMSLQEKMVIEAMPVEVTGSGQHALVPATHMKAIRRAT